MVVVLKKNTTMKKPILRINKAILSILVAGALQLSGQPSIQLVKQFKGVAQLTELGGKLIFNAAATNGNNELWESDGTTSGTVLLKDINVGTSGSSPSAFKKALGKVFFNASNPSVSTNRGLYVTDGTSAGTIRLIHATESAVTYAGTYNGFECNGKFIFEAHTSANGVELWVSDGTVAGTQLLKDINPGAGNGIPLSFGIPSGTYKVVNNKLFFHANDGVNGEELWVTDGTNAGTFMLKDINVGAGNGISHNQGADKLGEFNNELYFNAVDASNTHRLYKSDGTVSGTILLNNVSKANSFTSFNNKLYFFGETLASGRELWISDGTVSGTALLKDINAGSGTCLLTTSTNFHLLNNKLYFKASGGSANGIELWETDGTTTGTKMVFDYTGDWNSSYDVIDLFKLGADFYYWDGQYTFKKVLLKLDLVTSTVTVVKDITVGTTKPTFGTNSSGNSSHTILGNYCFTPIDSALAGINKDVWVTDGTGGGTKRLTYSGDITNDTGIDEMQVFNSEVFFTSDYLGSSNRSLFKISGALSGLTENNINRINFSVYPNPAKDILNISITSEFNLNNTEVRITNLLGQEVFQSTINAKQTTISTSHLNSGIYFIIIESNGTTSNKKIIIE